MTTTQYRQTLKEALPATLTQRMKDAGLEMTKQTFTDLVHILQQSHQMPLGYRFTLYVYGPQCPELDAELEMSKLKGLVDTQYDKDTNSTKVTPGPRRTRIAEASHLLAYYQKQIENTVSAFGHLRPGELNLRSSIIFVSKDFPTLPQEEGEREDRIARMIWALKPHQGEEKILESVRELRKSGYIR